MDGFILHNVESDEQGCGLFGILVGGHRRHFAHPASDGKDGAAFNDKRSKVAIKSLFGRAYLTPSVNGAASDDDGRGVVLLVVVVAKRHEETAFGIGVDGVVAHASGDDVGTVELDGGVGIDGIISGLYVHMAAIKDDAFLALDAFCACGGGPDGYVATVDRDFALRSNTLGRSDIFVVLMPRQPSPVAMILSVPLPESNSLSFAQMVAAL